MSTEATGRVNDKDCTHVHDSSTWCGAILMSVFREFSLVISRAAQITRQPCSALSFGAASFTNPSRLAFCVKGTLERVVRIVFCWNKGTGGRRSLRFDGLEFCKLSFQHVGLVVRDPQ